MEKALTASGLNPEQWALLRTIEQATRDEDQRGERVRLVMREESRSPAQVIAFTRASELRDGGSVEDLVHDR